MRVRIMRGRVIADAGVDRPLSVGSVYDLPAGVASSLVAGGVAVAADEAAVMVAPETRPMQVPEQKARRRSR